MRISEMIRQLEDMKERDGDIEVLIKLPYGIHAVDFHMNAHAANYDSPTCYLFHNYDSRINEMWLDHIKSIIKSGKI